MPLCHLPPRLNRSRTLPATASLSPLLSLLAPHLVVATIVALPTVVLFLYQPCHCLAQPLLVGLATSAIAVPPFLFIIVGDPCHLSLQSLLPVVGAHSCTTASSLLPSVVMLPCTAVLPLLPSSAATNCRYHLLSAPTAVTVNRCYHLLCRNCCQPLLPPTTTSAAASSAFSPAPTIAVVALVGHQSLSPPPLAAQPHLPHLPPLVDCTNPRLCNLLPPNHCYCHQSLPSPPLIDQSSSSSPRCCLSLSLSLFSLPPSCFTIAMDDALDARFKPSRPT
ncbi:hypothetical protein GW17_00038287 [Ensete ventricosum]|nr:hypothetical protein GW17_00038287 [Ensete ventricosum]